MLCMNSMVQSGKEAIEVFKSKLSKERERERARKGGPKYEDCRY